MWPSILMLLATILSAIILAYAFLIPLLIVAINVGLLYLAFIKVHADITKRNETKYYLISLTTSITLIALIGNILPLWTITTIVLIAVLIEKMMLVSLFQGDSKTPSPFNPRVQ